MRVCRTLQGLALISLLHSAVTAQPSFPPPSFPGETATSFDVVLTAREHLILPDLLHPNAVVVKEVSTEHPHEGQLTDTRVGLPNLSVRELSFLLPYDASFWGLELEVLQEVSEPIGIFEIAPIPILEEYSGSDITSFSAQVPPGVQLDPLDRDAEVYAGPSAYPSSPVEIASVGEQRAARILRLAFHPFRWNPVTRELTKIQALQVRVSWRPRFVPQARRDRELGDPRLSDQLATLTELGLHVREDVDFSYDHLRRETEFDYLIIASEVVITYSDALDPFIQLKTDQGHNVAVRSVEWIVSSFPASSTERSVREFLRSIYQDVGLRYLLIISGHLPLDVGNPGATNVDDIPMFLTWPSGGNQLSSDPTDEELEEHKKFRVPTDLYYAELSMGSNWDVDGDGFAGERRDDVRSFSSKPKKRYVTDYHQELIVARIPFNDHPLVDRCLVASIEYQTTSPEAPFDAHHGTGLVGHLRSQVWLAMAETCWWGANFTGKDDLGDAIVSDLAAKFAPHKMYQVGTWDEELRANTFVNKWDDAGWTGPGLAIWAGHGNEKSTSLNIAPLATSGWSDPDNQGNVIERTDPARFNPFFTRAFVASSSCQNASPFTESQASTLLEELMLEVAVGAILNTGNAASNPARQDDFGDHRWNGDILFGNVSLLSRGFPLGLAVFVTRFRGDYSGEGGTYGAKKAMNLLSTNAFGDPSIEYDVGWGWLGD